MTNLTLSIDEKLLQAARIRAVKEKTSVNEICRQALEAYARSSASQRLARYQRVQAEIDAVPRRRLEPLSSWASRDAMYEQAIAERHPTLMGRRKIGGPAS